MEYRQLGKSGLRVSELSFGSWITFGTQLDLTHIRNCFKAAVDVGVIFFDTAEAYGHGTAELLMGEVLRDFRRENLVISTKLFRGGENPNAIGLSRKHLMEGIKNSLRRLQIDYVDLLYCHRPDPHTPIEETVYAMDDIIKQGYALYWGTSEWPSSSIEEAHFIAESLHAIPPSMEQPEYNLFHRHRVEKEYLPLVQKFGMGMTTWSPLESGILTGKYNQGIPPKSRFDLHPEFSGRLTQEKIEKVKELAHIATSIDCTLPQLAIAWCLKNKYVSSVILGATSVPQLRENLLGTEVKKLLSEEVLSKIEEIVS